MTAIVYCIIRRRRNCRKVTTMTFFGRRGTFLLFFNSPCCCCCETPGNVLDKQENWRTIECKILCSPYSTFRPSRNWATSRIMRLNVEMNSLAVYQPPKTR